MGITIISFVIVLGILVFVHEFGHFITARLCGVGVEKFSVGFGPRLFGWKRGMTDYMVSAIPLGGYVKMIGEEPDCVIPEEEKKYSFTHKNVWKRFLIVGAGPFFNFFLAIILYFFLYLVHGIYYYPAVIGEFEKGSPAFSSGLKVRDLVLSVDGKEIDSWSDFSRQIKKSKGKVIVLKIKRGNIFKEIIVKPEKMPAVSLFGEKISEYSLGIAPYIPPVVGDVLKNSPAMKAGVRKGDIIVSINGKDVNTWNDVTEIIRGAEKALDFIFKRNQEIIKMNIVPLPDEYKDHLGKTIKRKIIGISAKDISIGKKLGIPGAFAESFGQTWKVIKLTFVGIGKMIDGTVSGDNLGGPIMIAQMSGDQARQGMTNFLAFIALISINLGLLNLLPVPVLDGGHLMFFFIEGITGKPVNLKARQIAQQVGLFLLLMLMCYAFYNDIMRFFFK
ncbi:MAG: RIP metalloprotease RseP [Deltaproteobacteria bacterium]|nr:MAG: RIP metalloprotease RseP [Deltaproteobacteria bacterium]